MRRVLAWLVVLLAGCGGDQPAPRSDDFDVLAQAAGDYAQARPGVPIRFPEDHGPHPDYRIEWWYVTANLFADDGTPHGAQWTLFRVALPPGSDNPDNPWLDRQTWMAHFAVTGPERHFGFQRYARGGDHGGIAQAGVRLDPFAAWLDDWELASTGEDWLPLRMTARQGDHAIDVLLTSDRAPVLQGEGGFSQKHPAGGGSHYYSQPWLRVEGTLTLAGEKIAVSGDAWLDREWSSTFLQEDQAGWDWFALHLESGEKLMLYRLRGKDGADDYPHGILLGADGSRRLLAGEDIRFQPRQWAEVAGREIPVTWDIALPELGREMTVEALHPDQWMPTDFAYWEGVILVSGDDPGSRGHGYLEMTGYAPGD